LRVLSVMAIFLYTTEAKLHIIREM
jgi:hypothetical protein